MAPLILHNVPDEELYVGQDGIQRPYAMVFPQDGVPAATRGRRAAAEKGSFGKSGRRARSKTGTPARQRDDPTTAAADRIWGDWKQAQTSATTTAAAADAGATSNQRKQGTRLGSQSIAREDSNSSTAGSAQTRVVNVPTEIILRGYKSNSHQYAAVNHYESLAGRICEDYPREPPAEMRRYKSDLRDTALTRPHSMTAEERAKVNRADGGEHWVKVTFESAQAADRAVYASPQLILNHLVYAEPYHGVAPTRDEALPETQPGMDGSVGHTRAGSRGSFAMPNRMNSGAPDWGALGGMGGGSFGGAPASTTVTNDSDTISTATMTGGNGTGAFPYGSGATGSAGGADAADVATGADIPMMDTTYTRRIPTARRANLLPAEQALMPQPSYAQRMLNHIPFLKWFTGNMIGNEVPRTEMGEFDWNKASLYWKFIWWLDATFGVFGGDILNADRDD